jgi:hypothetical protein
VNLSKRIEALNDLIFYNFTYKVKLTSKIINEIYDSNKSFDDLEQFLGKITLLKNRVAKCENRVSALNREKADEKISEWLGKAIETEIIESYEVTKVEEKTFNQELEEQNLSDFMINERD